MEHPTHFEIQVMKHIEKNSIWTPDNLKEPDWHTSERGGSIYFSTLMDMRRRGLIAFVYADDRLTISVEDDAKPILMAAE